MRAAVLHGAGDLRVQEMPVPAPRAGEVLIEVGAVGLCGTDAAEYRDGPVMTPVHRRNALTGHLGPVVLGHEFAGTVVEVGPEVPGTALGRSVASCGFAPCGQCPACQAGQDQRCERYAVTGLHRDGGAAEFVRTPWESCEPLEQRGLTTDAGALGQPMAVAVHAARRARATAGERVLLIGAGGIGALLCYVFAALGTAVTVVEPDAARRELAVALGAQSAVPPGQLPELPTSRLDIVAEASGSREALAAALGVVPRGARLLVVGLQHAAVPVDVRRLTLEECEVIGTNGMSRRKDFPTALDLLAERPTGWADIAPLAWPLGSVAEVLAGGHDAPKALVDPRTQDVRATRTAPRR